MGLCGRIMRVEVIFIVHKNLQHIVDNLGIIRQLYDKDVIISVLDKDKVVQGFSLPREYLHRWKSVLCSKIQAESLMRLFPKR